MSFFWSGYHLQDFLFKSFDSKSLPGFFGICIALFSVGVLFEGMYFLKKDLLQKFLDVRKLFREERRRSEETEVGSDNDIPSPSYIITGEVNPSNSLLADNRSGNSSSEHFRNFEFVYLFLSSVIHALYACVGYTLMNAVMTFNIWILIAVCMGIGVGYFFFRTSEISDISGDMDDCQTRCSIEATDVHENEQSPPHHVETNKTDLNRGSKERPPPPPSPNGSNSARAHSSMSNESQNNRRKILNRMKDDEESTNPGPKVLVVVGAQVHNNFQQSA